MAHVQEEEDVGTHMEIGLAQVQEAQWAVVPQPPVEEVEEQMVALQGLAHIDWRAVVRLEVHCKAKAHEGFEERSSLAQLGHAGWLGYMRLKLREVFRVLGIHAAGPLLEVMSFAGELGLWVEVGLPSRSFV